MEYINDMSDGVKFQDIVLPGLGTGSRYSLVGHRVSYDRKESTDKLPDGHLVIYGVLPTKKALGIPLSEIRSGKVNPTPIPPSDRVRNYLREKIEAERPEFDNGISFRD